jgi:hypothetical protein
LLAKDRDSSALSPGPLGVGFSMMEGVLPGGPEPLGPVESGEKGRASYYSSGALRTAYLELLVFLGDRHPD